MADSRLENFDIQVRKSLIPSDFNLGLLSSELEVITPILEIKFRDSTRGEPYEGMPEELFIDEGEDPYWHYIVRLWEDSQK